ncbi:hypothetical protein XNC1_0534 [Xenorhabdus nematophila ATCC 19061]|uniref:Uncharacterized protein n=1 Tax=Xenorhabdus nematophila (strain ATCC 19061 / DSM 3370 / CCUG 14189 / LMG 1036 / NCIMB 9965 / AN6) TaxID=406817 RepID=D3VIQ8_XENNA|nr:hypothetical protein XNC1_0534 [Xenorhabdus nematophila ATCC 19061]CEK21522.1 hypothetical protein XNC2_0523 [Xenorhabdus nematophila AN6/1]
MMNILVNLEQAKNKKYRRVYPGRERERFLSLNCMLYNHISSKNNSEWSYQGIY